MVIIIAYFNDKILLISDSLNNINLFRLNHGKIIRHYFDNKMETMSKEIVVENALEYDVSIDTEDNIYLIYQDTSFDLILIFLKDEEVETIKLTGEPIFEVYYLNLINIDRNFIFLFYITKRDGKKI